jgi:cysteine desulfurase / selenocysteine lyase
MPITKKWAYFDHAAVSPLPRKTQQSIENWLCQATDEGDAVWGEWSANSEQLRKAGARLLGAHRDEIAIVANTTIGINMVAQGLRWRTGDNIVVPENEFPSNLLPWLNLERMGVEIRQVPVPSSGQIDLQQLDDRIDKRTRLVAISWVGFSTGYRLPLAEVCELVHRKGAKLLVDAIQGLGVFDLDVRQIPVDFVVADGHKWMLGPEGVGLFFIKRECLDELDPVIVGWASVNNAQSFSVRGIDLKPDASRFEFGSANMIGICGLKTSLQLLLEHGCNLPDNPVAESVLDNADYLVQRLLEIHCDVVSPRDRSIMSGIVSFDCLGIDPMTARSRLQEQGVIVSVRCGHIRAATHAYNDTQDCDRLIDALCSVRDAARVH